MSQSFSSIADIIQRAYPRVPAVQLRLTQNGQTLYHQAFGFLDPDTMALPTTVHSRFDMASVTKLFTTTAFISMVEEGHVSLDTPVSQVLPEFRGMRPVAPYEAPLEEGAFVDVSAGHRQVVDAGKITFRHLLTHSSGLPAWRPLYEMANRSAAAWSVLCTYFSYQPGERVVYSDLGLILVGFALEKLAGERLDRVIARRVCEPLSLKDSGFLPYREPDATGIPNAPIQPIRQEPGTVGAQIVPTEICRWRKRRLVGEVDDENCGRLGGIAGHAGFFSTAADIGVLGESFLRPGALLNRTSIAEMTRLQSPTGEPVRRGIGFDLWTDDPGASVYPFSPSSFGHTGFTGTSLWIDPQRQLVVALLTNEVYHGRTERVIGELRKAIYRAVVEIVG